MATDPASTQSIAELLAARDPTAAGRYYDRRAPAVAAYCRQVCPAETVDEAVLAAFIDLLGRLGSAGNDADPDELLRKATRVAAAARMNVDEVDVEACTASPGLIAANMNDELPKDVALKGHLDECEVCVRTADRLTEAEAAFEREPGAQAPAEPRRAWLELMSDQPSHDWGSGHEASFAEESRAGEWLVQEPPPAAAAAVPTPSAEAMSPEPSRPPAPEPREAHAPEPSHTPVPEPTQPLASEPTSATGPSAAAKSPAPIRVRRRRGGLVGIAKGLIPRPHRDQ